MKFKNVTQLLDHFKDEATCRAHLEAKRWGGVPACHHCGSVHVYRTNRGFKCAEKLCGKKFTVLTGSIYENTKLPIRIWFAAIYLCTSSKKGISSLQASRQLGITQKSAWFLLHRVREMLKEKAPLILKEEVQVDESYLGGLEKNKHKNKRTPKHGVTGRRAGDTKTPVIGLVETKGKVVAIVVPAVTRKLVEKIIESTIDKDATMVTDAHGVYYRVGYKYKHEVVNHTKGEYKRDGFHTNNIENFWSLLKRGIYGIYHQVSPWHLQRYVNEFAARYNSRKITDDERFDISLSNTDGRRLKYQDLIK